MILFDSPDFVTLLAFTDFERLNRLDDLWTSHLSRPRHVPPEEAEMLGQITEEMGNLLEGAKYGVEGITVHAKRLMEFIDKRYNDVERAFPIAVAAASLSPNERGDFERRVKERGGFARFAIEQLTILEQENGAERELLRSKMRSITEGGISTGDLTKKFKCALGVALLAASVCVLVASGTILVPAVVAAAHLGPAAIAAAFAAHAGGPGMLLDGAAAVEKVNYLTEHGCFQRNP